MINIFNFWIGIEDRNPLDERLGRGVAEATLVKLLALGQSNLQPHRGSSFDRLGGDDIIVVIFLVICSTFGDVTHNVVISTLPEGVGFNKCTGKNTSKESLRNEDLGSKLRVERTCDEKRGLRLKSRHRNTRR